MNVDSNVHNFLSDAFQKGHASHAYVVVGEKPVMKDLLKLCASVVLCDSHTFDNCNVCHKVDTEIHQDVIYLPTNGKTSISNDDVMYLIEESIKRPIDNGSARVFLLNATESVNSQGSQLWQNKLLKTLEEPIDGVYMFIGVTDVEGLLPTVRSRCQVLYQTKLDVDEVKDALVKKGYNTRISQTCAVMSGGSLVNAERLVADSVSLAGFDYATQMLVGLSSTKNALLFADVVPGKSEDRKNVEVMTKAYAFLSFASMLLGESLNYRIKPSLLRLTSYKTEVEQIGKNFSLQATTECIILLDKAKKSLDEGSTPSIVIDKLLMNISEVKYRCRQ